MRRKAGQSLRRRRNWVDIFPPKLLGVSVLGIIILLFWDLSDRKSLQVSRILLFIRDDFNNAVVWIVSARPPISKFSSSSTKSFSECTERTNYNWYHCHFHVSCFFQFPNKVQVHIFIFIFFQFYLVVSWDSKVHNSASSLFLADYTGQRFFTFWILSIFLQLI